MPKKIYHIPTQKVKTLLAKHHSELQSLLGSTKQSEYHKRLSKAHYLCEVEAFLKTFGIDKEIGYALKLLGYFESSLFYETLSKLIGGERKGNVVLEVLLQLRLVYLYDRELYALFLRMVFVHYSTEQTAPSNVHIDHQAIATHLAKQLGIKLNESFGTTENNQAFFDIYHDEQRLVGTHGKSIKTLRKKAYKQLVEVLSERMR